jgi:glycosyltransferase involved in cell wall biosynthesis
MEKQSAKVSFIVPYFNSGNTIQDTIDSIFNQSYDNFDIWIVNDGSTESDSLIKLEELSKIAKINVLHQQNSGPSVARNTAIRQSDAQFIVPLDADDLISEHAINHGLVLFQENESIGVVYGNLAFFGEKNEVKVQGEFDIFKQLLWNQIAVCAIVKKEVFEDVGFYDEFLSKPGLEDWEFWIRVFEKGWRFKKYDEIAFNIRINNHSRTFQVANPNMQMIKDYVYQKHLNLLLINYQKLYYDKKMLLETPDYRIGNFILRPYRWLKKLKA